MEHINNKKIRKVIAKDPHELTKVHGLGNMAEVLELMIRALLYRKESRGGFVRDDYPETDNISRLKWIIIKRQGNEASIPAEPIPIDKFSLAY